MFVPLAVQTRQVIVDDTATSTAARLVERWLDGSSVQATDLDLDDGRLTIDVAGPRRPPDPQPVATELAAATGEPVEVRVRWTQRTEITAGMPDHGTRRGGPP